jgi:type IV pilus assembly protein PilW
MRARQNGFTLVEIMIAVAIGLIAIVIITQAYIASDRFNRSTLGEGGAQTNGLIALFTLERDVRMAGYGLNNSAALGCGVISWYYDPNYSGNIQPGSPLPTITLAPVLITVTAGEPDRITVMFSTDADRIIPTSITKFNAKSSEVTVDGTTGFQDGDLVLLVNQAPPQDCTMGKITHVQGTAAKLQLNPGANGQYNPPAWGLFTGSYGSNDMVFNLGNPVVRSYFIDTAAKKLRATDALLQAAGATPYELVDGIIDLRAQYGKDTNNDGAVDTWNNVTPATSAEWLQVLALRVGVLARIGAYEKPSLGSANCDATTAAAPPTWAGGAFPGIDVGTVTSEDRCYRYRAFETIIPIRNMIWKTT